MTQLFFVLAMMLWLSACEKAPPGNPQLPDLQLLEAERQRADLDDDDIPDVDEIDKTRLRIQIPKLRPGPKTSVDLTYFYKNGQAETRVDAVMSAVEAPIRVLDILAKKMGEKRSGSNEFFQKMAEMENCWVLKDLFHPLNRPDNTEELLRLSVKILPEVWLEGVPELNRITGIKLKMFSLGEDGDVAYFPPGPSWVNEFKEELEIPALNNEAGYKGGSITMDFNQGHGLEFLRGQKRQLGFCIDDFSYEINSKKRTLGQVIKKTKLSGVALNFSNGLKYSKIYFVKKVKLSELLDALGKEYEYTSEGKFVLDTHIHSSFKIDQVESLLDEALQHGPWISISEISREPVKSESTAEDLRMFLEEQFAPKAEIGLIAIPIYKILRGLYPNTGFIVKSAARSGSAQIELPRLAPGEDVDLILSAQESIPKTSDLKVISVEACVNIGTGRREKNKDCGDDYRGWCGVYHRDLVYLNQARPLEIDILQDVEVMVGERRFSLRQFVDERFTTRDSLGRIHFRARVPLTLGTVRWIFPKIGDD